MQYVTLWAGYHSFWEQFYFDNVNCADLGFGESRNFAILKWFNDQLRDNLGNAMMFGD